MSEARELVDEVLGAYDVNGGAPEEPYAPGSEDAEWLRAQSEEREAGDQHEPAAPYEGLTHDQAKARELPAEGRYLVDGLVPAAAVGTIAGVPEAYKSFLAQATATRCAVGEGEVLGYRVERQTRVGYFWQDDSEREELERIQLFEQVHETPNGLPLRWFLNEGVSLPRDLERLRATVEQYRLELCVLDSFYNFAVGVDLREAEAEVLVARLKSEIADPCKCTVLVVDHMPWATEQNRKRLRAYGGVHKGAAVRFGIYIDVEGKKLWIEARGNNIRGFKRRPAYWDEDALELRLVEKAGPEEHESKVEERAEAALEWLVEHPGRHSTTAVRQGVGGRESVTDEALEALKARAGVLDLGRDGGPWSGRSGDARYWIASVHAASEGVGTSAPLFGPGSAEVAGGGSERATPAASAAPRRGAGVVRAEVPDDVPQPSTSLSTSTSETYAAREEPTS